METRGVALATEARERIEQCEDVETLAQWLVRAVTAKTLEDVFEG